MPLLGPDLSEKIGTLQLLDDAIAYRLDRLNRPCQHCRPDARCAGHRHDEQLNRHLSGQMRRSVPRRARWDGRPRYRADHAARLRHPSTAAGLSLIVMTRLRELVGSPGGPVVIDLDRRPVVIELDGRAVFEDPLTRGNGPWPRRATPPRPGPRERGTTASCEASPTTCPVAVR